MVESSLMRRLFSYCLPMRTRSPFVYASSISRYFYAWSRGTGIRRLSEAPIGEIPTGDPLRLAKLGAALLHASDGKQVMALLKILSGDRSGQTVDLRGDVVVVGRHPGCDIRVPDETVSRRHARIISQRGGYFVEDLGSRNGTFLTASRSRR